ncbi:hypothetical protein B0T11DRAFT_50096 [Plectosphaerella cucumerina]|uniref:Uncharacterized protein n=1 Tax=Plectosphaerella cucumerina TaxID=40658 RepID=A0A8K0TGE0_9PEZI|nr:hypothetical protein B0T11DRAFT_50096 [Plectosphaerella cucumerina]
MLPAPPTPSRVNDVSRSLSTPHAPRPNWNRHQSAAQFSQHKSASNISASLAHSARSRLSYLRHGPRRPNDEGSPMLPVHAAPRYPGTKTLEIDLSLLRWHLWGLSAPSLPVLAPGAVSAASWQTQMMGSRAPLRQGCLGVARVGLRLVFRSPEIPRVRCPHAPCTATTIYAASPSPRARRSIDRKFERRMPFWNFCSIRKTPLRCSPEKENARPPISWIDNTLQSDFHTKSACLLAVKYMSPLTHSVSVGRLSSLWPQ